MKIYGTNYGMRNYGFLCYPQGSTAVTIRGFWNLQDNTGSISGARPFLVRFAKFKII